MTQIDNGGAIAIKGFNYQKASIVLVMLNNYQKKDFKIIPEARDDFEVSFENNKVFLQVKGTKRLSLTKLIGKNSDSIIQKNLVPGTSNDIRKIFLWDIIESTKENLVLSYSSNLVPPVYKFSDIQREDIIKKLKLDKPFIERLNEQYIYITPFPNNLKVGMSTQINTLFIRAILPCKGSA